MAEEKIERIWYATERLYLKEPLKIANENYSFADTLLVFIKAGKFIGIGEAAPDTEVTGETISSVKSFIDNFSGELIGKSCNDIELINYTLRTHANKNPAAMAGIDIALYDLKGKVVERSLVYLLGGTGKEKQISVTIGIENDKKAVIEAVRYKKLGFKIIKVKVGLDLLKDLERVRRIRMAVGNGVLIAIDANQGYTVNQSLEFLQIAENYNILFLEQPLDKKDLSGMSYLRKNSSIPIMADESVQTLKDLQRIIAKNAADMINIKLMKMGGITRSLELYNVAIKNNLKVMVGCMEESRIGIAAGTVFALSIKDIGFADLDSHLSHSNKLVRSGISTKMGRNILSGGNGLGLKLNQIVLKSYR